MARDPIVEEIHKLREQIMAECNNNLEVVFKRIQELEKKHPGRLVGKKDLPEAG